MTGKGVFGHEEALASLDAAWADPQVNLVTVVAWASLRPRDNTRSVVFRYGGRGGLQYNAEDLDAPAVVCLCYEALCQWHAGEIASCHPTMEEAISLAKELNETNSLAVALHFPALLAHFILFSDWRWPL